MTSPITKLGPCFLALTHLLLKTILDELNKVTIIPRSGGIEGFNQSLPNEDIIDSGLYTRNWLVDRITVALGGLCRRSRGIWG